MAGQHQYQICLTNVKAIVTPGHITSQVESGDATVQYSNMSLGDYIQKNVLNPANLTDTFYWNGAPGTQPNGLRHQMLPIPGYIADFSGNHLASHTHTAEIEVHVSSTHPHSAGAIVLAMYTCKAVHFNILCHAGPVVSLPKAKLRPVYISAAL